MNLSMTRLREIFFRDFDSATWTVLKSAPDRGFESNSIARHHTQLKSECPIPPAKFGNDSRKPRVRQEPGLELLKAGLSALGSGNSAGFGID